MTTQAERRDMTPAEKIEAWAAEHFITMDAEFIPYSVAIIKRPEWKSEGFNGRPWVGISWKITLKRAGRAFLETDYSAGIAHCPGYKLKRREGQLQREYERNRDALCAWECENGKAGRWASWGITTASPLKRLQPELADVLSSLRLDASVLDEGSFEDWAASLGYDTDSRKAESIYRACLEIALKLRAAVGDHGLSSLAEAAQDY